MPAVAHRVLCPRPVEALLIMAVELDRLLLPVGRMEEAAAGNPVRLWLLRRLCRDLLAGAVETG